MELGNRVYPGGQNVMGLLSTDGSSRMSAEGSIREDIARLEARLAAKRALLEMILKASPLSDQADQALWSLLMSEAR